MVVYIIMAGSIVFICGTQISGKIISRIGYKKATMLSVFGLGFFTILLFTKLHIVISIGLDLLLTLMGGLYQPSITGLCLGQLPELRGSMMSMRSAFLDVGTVISVSLSGFLLIQYGWMVMALAMGVFCFISGLFVILYTQEPSI